MHQIHTHRHLSLMLGLVLFLTFTAFSNAKKQSVTPQTYLSSIQLDQPLSQDEVDGFVDLLLKHGLRPDIPESAQTKQLSWTVGPNLEPLVRLLEVTDDRRLLAYLTQMADYLMAKLNNPQTGKVDFLTEVRAPVWYWTIPAPNPGEELNDIRASKVRGTIHRYHPESRDNVYWADPLCTGAGYMFSGRLALYILNTPEIHELAVIKAENYNPASGSTYLAKATHWLKQGHITHSYFLKTIWFDKGRLLWHQKKDPALDKYSTALQGSVLAYNRYLKYNMGYDYIAQGLRKLDPQAYGPWADQAEEIIKEGILFWKQNISIRHEDSGLHYIWPYLENGPIEDTGHLIFDLNAIAAFKQRNIYPITNEDMTAIGNSLVNYCYNHKHQKANQRMDGSTHKKKFGYGYTIPGMLVMAPWNHNVYTFYAPKSLVIIKNYANQGHFKNRVLPLTAKLLAAKAAVYGLNN